MNTRTAHYTREILPGRAAEPGHYAWRWQRENRQGVTDTQSVPAFRDYYDRVMGAQEHGFEPEMPRRLR